MSIAKLTPKDKQDPELNELRNDCLSLANKLDKFSENSPWPEWIKQHSEMLRHLARDIAEKDTNQ
ncbi:MAG: hypothetical protein ACRBCK_10050 [Alphaproteobacteria bacterium]